MNSPRHVRFTELGLHTAKSFGHPDQEETLNVLLNSPPLARHRTAEQIMSLLVYQQSAMIELLQELKEIRLDVAAIKRDVAGARKDAKSAQTRIAVARENTAKAEERAAKARERAAIAEAVAKTSQPPLLIQVGTDLSKWESRINRKF